MTPISKALATLLVASALVSAAHASPTADDNAGRWVDTYLDDAGVLSNDGVELDPVGRRMVLAADATEGTFVTTAVSPASASAWGSVYLDASIPSDAELAVWVERAGVVYGLNGQTGTPAALPAPLALTASDRSGYTRRAALTGVPVATTPLSVRVRLRGATLRPAVSALEVTWTPRSIVGVRVEGATSIKSAETLSVRVNVAVSFVDSQNLVVEAPLPVAQPNPASALQDQRVTFLNATGGGALSADGTKVVWNLGTRKAGETFPLVYTVRTNMGLIDQLLYRTTATATLSNGTANVGPALDTRVTSTTAPVLERLYGAGIYRIDGVNYAFPDSEVEVVVQGWNYRGYPSSGGETLFDAVVWDDASAFVANVNGVPATGGPTSISNDGVYTPTAVTLPDGTVIPAKSVYWRLSDLEVGELFQVRYRVKVGKLTADGGPFTGGEVLRDCATLGSDFATQLPDRAGPVCAEFKVGVPIEPTGVFAKGEEIRGIRGVNAGEDLVSPVQVKAAFGETMSYHLLTHNSGVSRLNDVVMIDKVPAEMIFEAAFLPPEANGTVWYYAEVDGPAAAPNAPPSFDRATGALGAGWSTTPPADPTTVSWVAFRVPELASTYFPDTDAADGFQPVSAMGEVTVTVRPPAGACPTTDTTIVNRGLFHVYAFTPPGQAKRTIQGGPLFLDNEERTLVVPDLPSLVSSRISDSPSTAIAGQVLTYQVALNNVSPPGTSTPMDDALDVKVRIELPQVPANGVSTPLLVEAVQAPGGTITYDLPTAITVTYPGAVAPNTSRVVTLATRVPPGVIDGTQFTINAVVDWRDDLCGPGQARLSETTGFFGLPALEVRKLADFSFGQTGTELLFTFDYVNSALSPSTRTWVADRVPAGLTLGRVEVPRPAGEVWFSQVLPATLPPALDPSDALTDARIRTHFVRAVDADGDGWVNSPYGAATTWVAFLVDDTTLNPPQLVTGTRRSVHLEATVTSPTLGAVIGNQAAILSKELIQAIGNKTLFTVTGRPGLRIAKSCAEVVATGEAFTYAVDYYNDSANSDTGVTLTETLPEGLVLVDVAHLWNSRYLANHPAAADPTITLDGAEIEVSLGGLEPLEGGRLLVTAVAADGLTSGTFLLPETSGTAVGADGSTRSGYAACNVLVENADIYVRKLVDNPAPRAGETFNYTLVVSNEGAHDAADVIIRDDLPSQLEVVPGTALATPSPWRLAPGRDPLKVGGALYWSVDTDNALTRGDGTPGLVPGRSGNISIIFAARVKDGVLPGTTLTNCASAESATGEDENFDNRGCVSITTPLPDPWVEKTGPVLKKPGEKATWTLAYGNRANEVAAGVVIIDSLPDGPIPAADGVVDVTFAGVLAPNGEQVWYHGGSPGVAPAFDPANPGATGWSRTPPAVVTHVAFFAGTLPPLAATRTVQVSALLRRPDGALSLAGSAFSNCASVAMTTSGYRDGGADNNRSCFETRIPGIDLAVDKTCAPSGSYPGVEPGDTIELRVRFANTGTVPAHGLKLSDVLPEGVELVAATSGAVQLVDAAGQATAPINEAGAAITAPVPWTKVGSTWYLGATETTSPVWYRKVGLRPGDHGELVLTVRVADGVQNDTTLTHAATITTDYGSTWVPSAGTEELLDNNTASCEVTVYRADPFIIKTVVNTTTGSTTVADVGDLLDYTLEYGNAGNFEASDVVLEDRIPEGLVFVVGGPRGVDPSAMVAELSDDGGLTWDYVPSAPVGTPDPAVTHVRVRWLGPMGAPVGTVFVQDTAVDFGRGTHVNTVADAGVEGVVPTGGNSCDGVECAPVDCVNGSWIPEGECCPVCRDGVDGCEKAPVELDCYGWSGCYNKDTCEGSCFLEVVELDPWTAEARACADLAKRTAGIWQDCVNKVFEAGGGRDQMERECDRFRCERLDASGRCEGGVRPLWEQCWRSECPDLAAYHCEAETFQKGCNEAMGYVLGHLASCNATRLGKLGEMLTKLRDSEAQVEWLEAWLADANHQIETWQSKIRDIDLRVEQLDIQLASGTISEQDRLVLEREKAQLLEEKAMYLEAIAQFQSQIPENQEMLRRYQAEVEQLTAAVEAERARADAMDCSWLEPEDTCGQCEVGFCEKMEDQHKNWGHVRYWRTDYGDVAGHLGLIFDIFRRAEAPFPTGILPVDAVSACAPGIPCGSGGGGSGQCAVDCPPCDGDLCQLCQICPNGASCAECLPGTIGKELEVIIEKSGASCETVRSEMQRMYDSCMKVTQKSAEACAWIHVPTCEQPAACTEGVYTSPAFPEGSGRVTAWERAVIHDARPKDDENKDIRYSVVDAETGEPVAGFADFQAPADGVVDLGAIDAAAHPELKLVAKFTGTSSGRFIPIVAQEAIDECGEPYLEGYHLNESGLVVGTWESCNPYGYTWSEEGGFNLIIPPDELSADYMVGWVYPLDVNDAGVVVGEVGIDQTSYRGFVWTAEGGWIDPVLEEGGVVDGFQVTGFSVGAVAADGRVAGKIELQSGEGEAATFTAVPFVWSREGGFVLLDGAELPQNAVHDATSNPWDRRSGIDGWGTLEMVGDVVAGSYFKGYNSRIEMDAFGLFRWNTATGEIEIAPTEELPGTSSWIYVIGMADDGAVVVNFNQRAWLWAADGSFTMILPAEMTEEMFIENIYATDIAPVGTVVGGMGSFKLGQVYDAFVYRNGVLTTLPRHPDFANGVEAIGINSRGDVLVHLYRPPTSGLNWWRLNARAAIWDGANYVMVDGYPPEVENTWGTWYVWDGFENFNDDRFVLGQAVGGNNFDGEIGIGVNVDFPYLWRPDPEGLVALLDWRVIYRSDSNPSFGLTAEVAGACADSVDNTATIATSSAQSSTANDTSTASIGMNRADLAVRVAAAPSSIAVGEAVVQWAVEAEASSEYDNPDWSAMQATGEPDVFDCDDNELAWAPYEDGMAPEWIELGYETPVRALGVDVFETYTFGFVYQIDLIEPDGTEHVAWWEGADDAGCGAPLMARWAPTPFLVERVRVHTMIDDWEEIDAVSLVSAPADGSGLVVWTVTVDNQGPGVAAATELAFTPPEAVGGATAVRSIGTLGAGESRTFTFAAIVEEGDAGDVLAASASVTSPTLDCDGGDNLGVATTLIGNWPNVYVGVSSPAGAPVGEAFPVVVTYGNNGNATASSAVVSFTLPAGLTVVDLPEGVTSVGGIYTAQVGDLAALATGELVVHVVADECADIGQDLDFDATITTTSVEVDTTDNAATSSTGLQGPGGQLQLALVASRGSVEANELVTFVAHFRNAGLAGITSPKVVVTLGAGFTYVAGSATPGVVASNGTLTWSGASLVPGGGGSFVFTARATGAALTASAEGSGNGTCPASALVAPIQLVQPGLHLVKGADRDTLCGEASDEVVTWTLTVGNSGASALADVVVTDLLPPGMVYVEGSITGPGATAPTGTSGPRWALGTLAPGAALTLGYQTRLGAASGGVVLGTAATATSGNVTRKSGTAAIRLDCEPELGLSKSWSAGCVIAGASRTLELVVHNHGSSPSGTITLTDRLAEGLDFVSSSVGTYDATTRTLTANLAALRPGQSATLSVAVVVSATAPGRVLTNTATLVEAGLPLASNLVTGATLACNDGNACTSDECAPAVGCVFPNVDDGTSCTDGDACTTVDSCRAGVCTGAEPVVCRAKDQCHGVGTCDKATGACSEPTLTNGTACNDGSACTAGETCQAGVCGAGAAVGCDDGNPCTTDRCDPAVGCVYDLVADGTSCDDDNACSTRSACSAGVCKGTFYLACNDENPCTIDGCDPEQGCVADLVEDGTSCEDGDLCTTDTTCSGGTCKNGETVSCADDNPCTSETCDPTRGCLVAEVPDGTSCDDGVACTSSSACTDGACLGTSFLTCDDGNPCTEDRCDAAEGCVATAAEDGTECDDGSLCTTGDVCAEGTCGGAPVVCGEPGECELEGACNPATGVCDFPAKAGDTPVPVRLLDLGQGAVESRALALSEGGLVVGAKVVGGADRAVVFGEPDVDLGPGEAVATLGEDLVVVVAPSGADRQIVTYEADGSNRTTLWTVASGARGAPVLVGGGLVAGQARTTTDVVALRKADGSVAFLTPAADKVDTAHAVGAGFVVGTREGTGGAIDLRAFRWSGGAIELLALPAGSDADTDSVAHAIGAAGHIGGAIIEGGASEAAMWRPDGSVVVLPPACVAVGTCLAETRVTAVDGFGGYLGEGGLADGSLWAFAGVLGGDPVVLAPMGSVASMPVAMSDEGLAIGAWTTAAGATYGFAWSTADGLVELAEGAATAPTHVNGRWVLGALTTANGNTRAFLWSAIRGLEDLGSLGGGTSVGHALDAHGRVAGASAVLAEGAGVAHAFVTGEPVFACLACEEDRDPPALVCPVPGKGLECVDGGASATLGQASARDTCSFPVEVSDDAPETFPVGATQVVFTARDALGNEASCAVVVNVVDTQAPTITCPETLSVDQPEGSCGAAAAIEVTTDDGCDPASVRTVSDAPEVFPVGETTVTTTAIDAAGNTAACVTRVTVVDNTPLSIACEEDLTVDAPTDFCGWPEAITAQVMDECAADVTVESEADAFPVGVSNVSFSATNDRGESASCVTVLTVRDVTPPVVVCNAAAELGDADLPGAYGATAEDACTAEITIATPVCVRISEDGAEEVLTEGCDVRVEGATVIIGEVEPGAEWKGTVVVRWDVTATDPSDNASTTSCETRVIRDRDGDGVPDVSDNCVFDANGDQRDDDGDGLGDVCDARNDGIVALGDGGCGGGQAGSLLALALAALALIGLRARRASQR